MADMHVCWHNMKPPDVILPSAHAGIPGRAEHGSCHTSGEGVALTEDVLLQM